MFSSPLAMLFLPFRVRKLKSSKPALASRVKLASPFASKSLLPENALLAKVSAPTANSLA